MIIWGVGFGVLTGGLLAAVAPFLGWIFTPDPAVQAKQEQRGKLAGEVLGDERGLEELPQHVPVEFPLAHGGLVVALEDQHVRRCRAPVGRGQHDRAAPQDGHVVGVGERLAQLVRDEHRRVPRVHEPPHPRQQLRRLARREHRRRLVEHERARAAHERLHDLGALVFRFVRHTSVSFLILPLQQEL